MDLPNCKCTEELITKIKAKNNIGENAFVYFRDQNIFNGSLMNAVIIEETVTTKSGKKRTKNSNVSVVHSYCPFCGKAYLTEQPAAEQL